MAQKLFSKVLNSVTKGADEALTAYRFVKENSSATQNVDMCDTIGEDAVGVVDASWDDEDEAVKVITDGFAYVQAGGAVAVGNYVCTDASGRAINAAGQVDPDYVLGRAMTASASAGDLLTVKLMIGSGISLGSLGGSSRVAKIPITIVAAATEQDTAFDIPANAVVRGVYLEVNTAEATGGTKTIDVGTLSTDSGNADGFLDGVSVAATGMVKGTLLNTGQTLGALLSVDEGGTGELVPEPCVAPGSQSVTYTLGSDDFAELSANIVIDYFEV